MNATERFTKAYDQLIGLGLPPRLELLYGKLAYHAGKDGKCHPKHSTLAREIGLKSARQVRTLIDLLHQLHLVEWHRGRYFNTYRVLNPDRKWISHLIGSGLPISDRKRTSYRKEKTKKRASKRSADLSSAFGLNNNNKRRGFSAEADVVVDGTPDRKPPRKPGALPKGWTPEQVKRLEADMATTLKRGGLERVTIGPQAAIQLIRKSGGATEAEIHEVLGCHAAARTSFTRAENPVGMLIHLVEQFFGDREGKKGAPEQSKREEEQT
jgi:hypothetical protein